MICFVQGFRIQNNLNELVKSWKDDLFHPTVCRSDGGAGPFRLMTNFPKKVFNDEDYENTLENLGLVPSAVLMVTK